MVGFKLQQYLHLKYPQKNARCKCKESKNLKNLFKIQKA